MTCREKLALEHPEKVKNVFKGGCKGCPYEYGYVIEHGCMHDADGKADCTRCWDREVYSEETEKDNTSSTSIDIHKIIDDAMEKKDRSVSLYISEHSVSVTVTPLDDEPIHWISHLDDDLYRAHPFECSNCHHCSSSVSVYCSDCGEQMHGVKEVKND